MPAEPPPDPPLAAAPPSPPPPLPPPVEVIVENTEFAPLLGPRPASAPPAPIIQVKLVAVKTLVDSAALPAPLVP